MSLTVEILGIHVHAVVVCLAVSALFLVALFIAIHLDNKKEGNA
jgi:hypothetical protein